MYVTLLDNKKSKVGKIKLPVDLILIQYKQLFCKTFETWCAVQDLNLRPTLCKRVALPTELTAHVFI